MKIQFPSRIELLIPDCGLLTDVIFKRKISSINLPFFFLCNFAAYRLQSYRGEEIKDTRMIKIPDYGAMASRYPEKRFPKAEPAPIYNLVAVAIKSNGKTK